MCEKWCEYIVEGNINKLKELPRFSTNSICNRSGRSSVCETPLSVAINSRDVACCTYILNLGANPSSACRFKYDGHGNKIGEYPIHRAIFAATSLEIAELLFLSGANMQQEDTDGLTLYQKITNKQELLILDHITRITQTRNVIGWTFQNIGNGWSDIILPLIERESLKF